MVFVVLRIVIRLFEAKTKKQTIKQTNKTKQNKNKNKKSKKCSSMNCLNTTFGQNCTNLYQKSGAQSCA